MNRRDFLKLGVGGMATLVVGSHLPWLRTKDAYALDAGQTLSITITDAIKEMVTHQDPALFQQLGLSENPNIAECYFWVYKMDVKDAQGKVVQDIPVECPGPTILAKKKEKIPVTITNELDEPHAFHIPGIFASVTVAAGETVSGLIDLTDAPSGAHLYYDDLNAPVNRVMGLHGALVVRPEAPVGANPKYPYDAPTDGVRLLFDEFGKSTHFPGLAWGEGDAATNVPACRQYVWLTHQASPKLFAEVGNHTAGLDFPAAEFVRKFLYNDAGNGPAPTPVPTIDARTSYVPQFFTINGQSGMFSHFSPFITPIGRAGEPVVVHILNAGLWTHSMHLHANHFYVTSLNGVVSENPIWVDVYNVRPMDRIDYTIPFMRCPDVPNVRGIGHPDKPLTTLNGHPCWPPAEELNLFIPGDVTKPAADGIPRLTATNIDGVEIDLKQRMSPLCFPMHDHSEPSQTAQGGNYNCGLISGMYFTGDRNPLYGRMDFPMDHDFAMMYRNIRGISLGTNPAPGVEPPQHVA